MIDDLDAGYGPGAVRGGAGAGQGLRRGELPQGGPRAERAGSAAGDDADAIRQKTEALATASHKLAEVMYQQAQAGPAGTEGGEAPGGGKQAPRSMRAGNGARTIGP